MLTNILYALCVICELVFAASIIYTRIGDREKTQKFFKKHRMLGYVWLCAVLIGAGTFFTHIIK